MTFLRCTRVLALAALCCTALIAAAQQVTFDYPKSWTLERLPEVKNGTVARAKLSSKADRLKVSIALMRSRKASQLRPQDLQDIVLHTVEDEVPKSVERKAVAQSFDNGAGMFVRLTVRDAASPHRYLTTAVHRTGNDLAIGQLFSNDDDGAMVPVFLHVVQSVESAKRPGRGATALTPTLSHGKRE